MTKRFFSLVAIVVADACIALACNGGASSGPADAAPASDSCERLSMEKLPNPVNLYLSPDGKKFAENKTDATGTYQVYVGDFSGSFEGLTSTCISCETTPGGVDGALHKFMVVWHPSGDWLFVGVPLPHWALPTREADIGFMQSGTYLQMYVTRPQKGAAWYPLTGFKDASAAGYTGPVVTSDGKAYWADASSGTPGDLLTMSFGRWKLRRSDFVLGADGTPSLTNTVDLTPPDTDWVEPGSLSPDGRHLLWNLDTGLDHFHAEGQDQWTMDLSTGAFTNLTRSADEWDEHGVYAPNGKIVFMSSHPYPQYKATQTKLNGLMTEFMLMDGDGGNLRTLTHFNEPGYPEYDAETAVAAVAYFTPDGGRLVAAELMTGAHFPEQRTWILTFKGRCGGG